MKLRHRVYAYITQGDRLLLLEHPEHPEAGLQVPGGTVEEHETPDAAVLREVKEETNLQDVELLMFLGDEVVDMRPFGMPERQHAWYYHLNCREETSETWTHQESHSVAEPIPFRFYWVSLPYNGPELITIHGAELPKLYDSLNLPE